MKPGDLLRLKDGYGTSSYNLETLRLSSPPDGPYFPPWQPALMIKVQESEPPPGCSRSVLLLGTNGLGWLPEHFLEVINEPG